MNSELGLNLTLLACGLLTFLTRFSFIAGGRRLALGPRLQALLRYVPPAVLAALIAPEVFMRDAALDLSPGNPRLIAAAVAAVVALRTRSVTLTIGVGLVTLWVAQGLLGGAL
ncbi:AzlD domain-containing protein [Niveibacterium sp. 24ML]|uniref:AzlD domain-containing protein n=1 Tax=Niveibacterium sp. 24ML TaxID=2985512 RepID=UPI00226DEA69|nr:AzlD domain-containing protein [Niveibacterium sp. 24ML]MCX9157691.1 AzlD domain-containing protein [Niveibacterium sp. 24ML]